MHRASFDEIESFLNTGGETRNFVRAIRPVVRRKLTPELIENLAQRQRAHWEKLHTTLMDSAMFAKWVASIPGCATCKRDFLELIKINPPRFDDWFRWGWEIHNAVSRKLNKTEFTWEKACELWGYREVSPVIENR